MADARELEVLTMVEPRVDPGWIGPKVELDADQLRGLLGPVAAHVHAGYAVIEDVHAREVRGRFEVAWGARGDAAVLTAHPPSERAWREGAEAAVDLDFDAELGGPGDPASAALWAKLDALGDAIEAWPARHFERLRDVLGEHVELLHGGATSGEVVPRAALGPDLPALEVLFEFCEVVLGGVPVVRRVPHVSIEAYTVTMPTLGALEGDTGMYLRTLDAMHYPMLQHLARLGYGWDAQGIVRTIPPPRQYARLVAAAGYGDCGFRPVLSRTDSVVLPERNWLRTLARGTFPVPVARDLPKLDPTLRETLRQDRALLGRHVGLNHDMGYHVSATQLIPRASMQRICAELDRAMVRVGMAEAVSWAEGPFSQTAADIQGTVERVEDFADAFEAEMDRMFGAFGEGPASWTERARNLPHLALNSWRRRARFSPRATR